MISTARVIMLEGFEHNSSPGNQKYWYNARTSLTAGSIQETIAIFT